MPCRNCYATTFISGIMIPPCVYIIAIAMPEPFVAEIINNERWIRSFLMEEHNESNDSPLLSTYYRCFYCVLVVSTGAAKCLHVDEMVPGDVKTRFAWTCKTNCGFRIFSAFEIQIEVILSHGAPRRFFYRNQVNINT